MKLALGNAPVATRKETWFARRVSEIVAAYSSPVLNACTRNGRVAAKLLGERSKLLYQVIPLVSDRVVRNDVEYVEAVLFVKTSGVNPKSPATRTRCAKSSQLNSRLM